MKQDCEFASVDGLHTCVVCGFAVRSEYPANMIHRNCPVDVIEDIESGGVGTELHKLLKWLGAKITYDCRCVKRIRVMNERGVVWCKQNVALIVQWLVEAAHQQKLTSLQVMPRKAWKAGARRVVLVAIARAERKDYV